MGSPSNADTKRTEDDGHQAVGPSLTDWGSGPGNVEIWKESDVRLWLQGVGMPQYAEDTFEMHRITGVGLLDFPREELKDMSIDRVGDRKLILCKLAE